MSAATMLVALLGVVLAVSLTSAPRVLAADEPVAQCSDALDNDLDEQVDYPFDPGCTSALDDNEVDDPPAPPPPPPPPPAQQCADGIDNDQDGATDHPADPGCASALDNDETDPPPPPKPQCSDGDDNDADGAIDFPAEPGCATALDNDETDPPPPPKPQCSDGTDNDADGKADLAADPGCMTPLDNDETDLPLPPPPACSDGLDNDGDAKADYGADPGCESPSDALEPDPAVASPPSPKVLSPFPVVRLSGRILRGGVRVSHLTVRAPSGSKITVNCRGPARSCPAPKVQRMSQGAELRVRSFERRLRGGTQLRIYVTRSGFIGKYTRFEIRARRPPQRLDKCARWVGANIPCP